MARVNSKNDGYDTLDGNGAGIPRHVAIIADGNGRWASRRHLPRIAGHRAGVENIRRVLEVLVSRGVEFVTLYAFSTENWTRPESEVRGLMRLLEEAIDRETRALHSKGIRVRHIGRCDRVSSRLRDAIQQSLALTRNNTRATLCIAFDYGGRDEILRAIKAIMADSVKPEDVNEELFAQYLDTAGIPDPDIIIRTGDEKRLSNFLIWQSHYSEFYFTPTLWPDFDEAEIEKALLAFNQRQRRFGALKVEA
jgi:undecaprenyl diphosphate synthase